MQVAVHLSSCYLEKLEFINQTPAFPFILTDLSKSLCILYEESQKVDTIWACNTRTFSRSKPQSF